MSFKLISVFAAGLLSAAPAFAANVTVDFDDLSGYGTSITNHYSAQGITFGADALTASNDELGPYFSNSPSGPAGSVMFAFGSNAAMNVASGFTGTVSFYYSALVDTVVSVYSGLNGTGTQLYTFNLAANTSSCSVPAACNWDVASVDLGGVAQSIQFGTAFISDVNDPHYGSTAVFDNVTVAPVPLPAAGWLLFSALGGFGAMARRKRA